MEIFHSFILFLSVGIYRNPAEYQQSAAVAAQYPSRQQYQHFSGQQPPGHGSPSHCPPPASSSTSLCSCLPSQPSWQGAPLALHSRPYLSWQHWHTSGMAEPGLASTTTRQGNTSRIRLSFVCIVTTPGTKKYCSGKQSDNYLLIRFMYFVNIYSGLGNTDQRH